MTKSEIASYLASLSSLLSDQDSAGGHNRSALLGAEFEKHWDILKSMIQKENDDATRRSDKLSDGRDKAGSNVDQDQSRRSGADRDRAGS